MSVNKVSIEKNKIFPPKNMKMNIPLIKPLTTNKIITLNKVQQEVKNTHSTNLSIRKAST